MAIQNRQLRTLLSLITNATEVAERRLSGSAQDGHNDPELRASIYILEAACTQLVCEVARPSDVLVNVSFELFQNLQVVISLSGNRNSWQ